EFRRVLFRSPTVRQHAGSYLPRTAFVVEPGRDGADGVVRRYRGELGVPDGGDLLVVARSGRPVLRDGEPDPLPRTPDTELDDVGAVWPASRWLEASTVAGTLGAAVAAALAQSYRWARATRAAGPWPARASSATSPS